ncbi:hypothetical protein [Ruegeria atlantica]|uniref:hypothetical protein n=1 Tax=Ruegeria atlantica TaxID=81569 RepID=UPI002495539A|nr:hypothetical protein [Ruegeria atlantica]
MFDEYVLRGGGAALHAVHDNNIGPRLYGKIGAIFFANPDTTVTARIGDGPNFDNTSDIDRMFWGIEVGLSLFEKDKTTLKLRS